MKCKLRARKILYLLKKILFFQRPIPSQDASTLVGKCFQIAGSNILKLVVTHYVKSQEIVVLITEFVILLKKIMEIKSVQ